MVPGGRTDMGCQVSLALGLHDPLELHRDYARKPVAEHPSVSFADFGVILDGTIS